MKTKPSCPVPTWGFSPFALRTPVFALLAIAGVIATQKIQAASQTWTNAPQNGSWTNVLNWNSAAVPGSINGTGNSPSADTATFTNPIPVSGIGSMATPIAPDDATISGDRARNVNSIIFDGPNCGAYVVASPSVAAVPSTGVLWVSHNGAIRINPPVTNTETILEPMDVILPSSTAGIFNLVNNSTNPNVAMIINSVTHGGANTRGTTFVLDGTNSAVNIVTNLSEGTSTGSGANSGGITKQGTNTWVIAGPGTFLAASAINVNAGTLIVQDPGVFGTTTTTVPTVNSNGVLQINAVTLNQSSITLNGGTLRVNGSATVNGVKMSTTLGASAKLATTSSTDVMTVGNAANQPSGGAANTVLHVTGPGTVLLSQPATYIGKWSLDAGITQLGTSSGLGTGPNLNIGAGAIFDVSPITTGGGTYTLGTTALSASGTGTTIGTTAAAINGDPSDIIDLASTAPAISLTFTPTGFSGDITHPALYIASGTLSLTGNAFSINNAAATPLGVGTYALIRQASGNITAGGGYSVVGVTGSGVAAGNVASVVVNGNEVDLVVSAYVPKNLVWTGGSANANWDIGTDANWLDGVIYSPFNNSDICTFNSAGSTNPSVNLVGTLAPGSVTVNTTANNYTFAGTGSIAGGATLYKVGLGTLLINTINTYGGGTVISNGVIQLGANNAVSGTGAGNVTVYSPGILDMNGENDSIDALVGNGTVDTVVGGAPVLTVGNNDNSGTFSGIIQNTSGTLGLAKNGNGTETLTAANTFSGPTTINSGTLSVANFNALGSGASAVTLNNGTLDMQTNVLVGTLAGAGGTIANNSTASTNALVVTNTSTFGGLVADGTGGGGVSVLVAGGTLRLNTANTYSGGTIVSSGAGLAVGTGAASAGSGGIIASNNASISQPNTGSSSSSIGNNITTVPGGTVTFFSSTTANLYGGQFFGGVTATNIYTGGNMSVGGGGGVLQFSNFLGTVIVTNGEIRWGTGAGPWGGDDTTFIFTGTGGCFTRDNTIVHLGALFGDGVITSPSVNPSGTYWIGAKNISSEYTGQISGSNNIVKGGSATLTLDGAIIGTNTDGATFTNYLYTPTLTYIGSTTVSNGLLVITAPNNLTNCSGITMAGSNAVLNAMNMGYVSNFNDGSGNADSIVITNGLLDVSSTPSLLTGLPQTLNGYGTIQGNLLVENDAILNPGLPTGPLTVIGHSEFAGVVMMNLDATNTPTYSEFVCSSITVDPTATLVVTNVGSGLINGTTFTLFSKPISGFASTVLPATDPTGTTNYTWANNLSVNGSITLTAGGLSPIATNPTNIVFSASGGNLTLSWPADHTGWYLQSQTNSLGKGLGTNWVDVPGSSTVNSMVVPINPANPTIFYRMSLNP